MINGAILSKSPDKTNYTHLNKIFQAMNNFQTSYNWLVTDCVAYPKSTACADCIAQAVHGGWVWLSGEELTMLVKTEDFQCCPIRFRSRLTMKAFGKKIYRTPIQSFRQTFTHSRDLKEYNTAVIQTCRETSIHPA